MRSSGWPAASISSSTAFGGHDYNACLGLLKDDMRYRFVIDTASLGVAT